MSIVRENSFITSINKPTTFRVVRIRVKPQNGDPVFVPMNTRVHCLNNRAFIRREETCKSWSCLPKRITIIRDLTKVIPAKNK